MKHRSEEGKREEALQNRIEEGHRRYARTTSVAEKEVIHAEIVLCSSYLEELVTRTHRYRCVNPHCREEYSATAAHGFGFLASWTRCDETGRPVRATIFKVTDHPKLGFCPKCAEAIEKDIDEE